MGSLGGWKSQRREEAVDVNFEHALAAVAEEDSDTAARGGVSRQESWAKVPRDVQLARDVGGDVIDIETAGEVKGRKADVVFPVA